MKEYNYLVFAFLMSSVTSFSPSVAKKPEYSWFHFFALHNWNMFFNQVFMTLVKHISFLVVVFFCFVPRFCLFYIKSILHGIFFEFWPNLAFCHLSICLLRFRRALVISPFDLKTNKLSHIRQKAVRWLWCVTSLHLTFKETTVLQEWCDTCFPRMWGL